MIIKTFTFNGFQVNSFVISNKNNECVIIDASCYSVNEKNTLSDYIESNSLTPKMLICTHGHIDHVLGNKYICDKYDLDLVMHKEDVHFLDEMISHGATFGFEAEASPQPTRLIEDGETITLGEMSIKVIHVPGHSPGGIALYFESEQLLIPGDIIFQGSVGRSDLPGGNHDQLISGIKEKIITLPDDTIIIPGHGPQTNIRNEKLNNPFLQ